MKSSTKDEIKGSVEEAKGAVKAKVGKMTNNPKLAAKGKVEELSGKAQKAAGRVKASVGK